MSRKTTKNLRKQIRAGMLIYDKLFDRFMIIVGPPRPTTMVGITAWQAFCSSPGKDAKVTRIVFAKDYSAQGFFNCLDENQLAMLKLAKLEPEQNMMVNDV